MKKMKLSSKAVLSLVLSAVLFCMPALGFAMNGNYAVSVHAEDTDPESSSEENKDRGWVIDGNYEKFCQKRRMKEADLIIFMDYPRWICLWQALRRYYRYKGHTRKSMADGCVEKMDKEFILWILKNGRSQEKKEGYKQVSEHYPDKFIQVRNRRQLRAAVIRLLQLQNEKGLYAGTGSRKR